MNVESTVIRWAEGQLRRPFQWGVTDCATLTMEALRQLTGKDYGSTYRGRWASHDEALAAYEPALPSDVLAGWGAREVTRREAVFGDVIAVPSPGWPEQLHFVLGRQSLASDLVRGVILIPTRLLTYRDDARVWRVAPCLKLSPY